MINLIILTTHHKYQYFLYIWSKLRIFDFSGSEIYIFCECICWIWPIFWHRKKLDTIQCLTVLGKACRNTDAWLQAGFSRALAALCSRYANCPNLYGNSSIRFSRRKVNNAYDAPTANASMNWVARFRKFYSTCYNIPTPRGPAANRCTQDLFDWEFNVVFATRRVSWSILLIFIFFSWLSFMMMVIEIVIRAHFGHFNMLFWILCICYCLHSYF